MNAALGAVKEKVGQAFGAHQCVPTHTAAVCIHDVCVLTCLCWLIPCHLDNLPAQHFAQRLVLRSSLLL